MKKYKLTKHNSGDKFRIEALINIPERDIVAGDFGGLVDGEHNLDQEGTCWIHYGEMVPKSLCARILKLS